MITDETLLNKSIMFSAMSPEQKYFALKKTKPDIILPLPTSTLILKKPTEQSKSYYAYVFTGQAKCFTKHKDFIYERPLIDVDVGVEAMNAIKKLFYSLLPKKITDAMILSEDSDAQPDFTFMLLICTNYLCYKEHYNIIFNIESQDLNPLYMEDSNQARFSNNFYADFEKELEKNFGKQLHKRKTSLIKALAETKEFLINIVKRLNNITKNIDSNSKQFIKNTMSSNNDNSDKFYVEINQLKSRKFSLAFTESELKLLERLNNVLLIELKIKNVYGKVTSLYLELESLYANTDTFKKFIYHFTDYFYLFALLNGLSEKKKSKES